MSGTPSFLRPSAAGLAAVAGVLFLGWPWLGRSVPEIGPLDPLLAAAPERVETIRLAPGQTFGEILARASLSWEEQNSLLLAFREQANPRRMGVGTAIALRWLVSEGRLRGVDVTLSRDETVRLTKDETGWTSELLVTPVTVDTLYAEGTVEDALWNAVLSNEGLSHLPAPDRAWVVAGLDQVFQWQIDFSRQVRAGDTYRFVVEREVRPDGSMRSGRILVAEYVNSGTPYRAVWFDPNGDGQGTYYDEEGKSVRRAFLTKPIELARISSRFSNARLHPILNTVRAHRGVDFAAPTGTPVMATGDGVVVSAGRQGDLGNLVEIRHPNGWLTRYGHLSRFGPGIRAGARVRQGQIVGYVGMTGLATGPHLHYEMRRRDGTAMDPLAVRLPPGDPVPSQALARWAQESRERLSLLERPPKAPPARMAQGPASPPVPETASRGGR